MVYVGRNIGTLLTSSHACMCLVQLFSVRTWCFYVPPVGRRPLPSGWVCVRSPQLPLLSVSAYIGRVDGALEDDDSRGREPSKEGAR